MENKEEFNLRRVAFEVRRQAGWQERVQGKCSRENQAQDNNVGGFCVQLSRGIREDETNEFPS